MHRPPANRLPRLAGLLLLLASAAAGQTAAAPPPPGKLVDVGGYRVHLDCTGAGSPTVMVVGTGFSFDWTLVQTEAARFTAICTYDVSGTAWSDPGPLLTCRGRVEEIHQLVHAARLPLPLVLVGLSFGGCVARLYAAIYPGEVSGLVIVDHAFTPDPPAPAYSPPGSHPAYDTPPVLIEQTPIVVTAEQASEFDHLPERSRELHRWALSLHPQLPTWESAEECLAALKAAAPGPFPLVDLPLAVVSTANRAPGYGRLQTELLALSRDSSHLVAAASFHSVEIDQPEVVVDAIRQVVERVRRKFPR